MGSYQNSFGGYSSNTNQDLNFSISSSKLSSNDSYEVQESEVPHIVSPPFNPSESNPSPDDGGSGPTMPMAPGMVNGGHDDSEVEFVDLDELAGADVPQIPYLDVNITEVGYIDEETIAIKDDQGNTIYMDNYEGEWVLAGIKNTEGDYIDCYNENITYLLTLFESNGIKIEGISFSEENGYFYVFTDQGDFLYDYDLRRCKFVGNENTELFSDSDIYSLLSLLTLQYGGYQGILDIFNDEYLTDEKIKEIMKQYFNEDFSEEQLQLLFARMRRVGCGYIVVTNTIFDQFQNLTDEEWFNLFGFERKNEDGQYNYQYLFLSFFLYYQQQLNHFESLDELLGNEATLPGTDDLEDVPFSSLKGANGLDSDYFSDIFVSFLAQYGIDTEVKTLTRNDSPNENYQEEVRRALENGEQVFLGTQDVDIYYSVDVDGNGELDDVYSYGSEAHGFTITGITEDGKWIVSTWGKEFIIDPNDIGEDTLLEIYTFQYQ